ncbi:MAG: acetyl-CoA C-acyltransferase, partial [Candidatus Eisenbacteria bacterium]
MNADRRPVIVSAARTAIGEYMKGLAPMSATQLGALAVREVVRRAGIEPDHVDEVILGNVVSSGLGQAPARQAAIHGGIPPSKGAITINKVCGSGLKAVVLASQAIRLADADVVVAGGMESMSNVPYYLTKARSGYRMGNGALVDGMIFDGLWDSFHNFHMGMAAEKTAEISSISREEQDRYACESHEKAVAAAKAGKFNDEIFAVAIPQRKGDPVLFDSDERPRADATVESLGKLRPAFKKDGTVTAGNAPGLNDGAAAVLVMAESKARELGVKPMARIESYAVGGRDPEMVFYAPIDAVRKLLERTGRAIGDYELIEINEAFAVQVLADGKELGWDWKRVNVNGGA